MECDRLKKLVKSWYLSVQEETMAPARMVAFMKQHIAQCDICLTDVVVEAEVERITAIVLPPSKIPKAQKKAEEDDVEPDTSEETTDDDSDEDEVEDDDDSDDDEDDDI